MSVAKSVATYLTKICWNILVLNEINKSKTRNKEYKEKIL